MSEPIDLIEALKAIDEKAPETLHLLFQKKLRKDKVKDQLGIESKQLKRIIRQSIILLLSNVKLINE